MSSVLLALGLLPALLPVAAAVALGALLVLVTYGIPCLEFPGFATILALAIVAARAVSRWLGDFADL